MNTEENDKINNLIEGVRVKKLKVIPDERGRLIEILRNDDDIFIKFGQVYITTAYSGVTKAWHYHKHQTDNFTVIKGMAKVVLYDDRENSPTKGMINEFFIGEHNPMLVRIPENVYHGYKCISTEEAIILNIPTNTYNYTDPDEYRADPHTNNIPYNWKRKDA
ncbi:dTDP-4-dehydrorhamnose 3,5-epimerase family protein [candidate division WOR-3 bacterium]|nr:dTDP-4-dehydrorhamnose 3,5-epimerase family protein [candidate division WOR-3 bacterium]